MAPSSRTETTEGSCVPSIEEQPWYRRLSWTRIFVIWGLPLIGFLAATHVSLRPETLRFAVAYYFLTGVSLSAGYHRLWSHRGYSATTLVKIILAVFGAATGEGSAMTWARDHRAHHRYLDTEQDPYSVHKGLWHAHAGWIILEQDRSLTGRVDYQDLKDDPIVVWQKNYYLRLFVLTAFVLPALFAGVLWQDWWGGLIYAGIIRMFAVQQSTFCINSVAHYFGDQPYSDKHSPRDSMITALLTGGEGYHNYHHEFPMDYRSGVRWYHYDPPKWAIWSLSLVGLTSDLKRFPENEVNMGRYKQRLRKLAHLERQITWGTPLEELPVMSWEHYIEETRGGHFLVCIEAVIYDVTEFIFEHPGGPKLLLGQIGKDATESFKGGVYAHSDAAKHLLSGMRFACLPASAGSKQLPKT